MVAIGLRKREPRRAADGLRQEGQVGSGRETYEEVSGGGGGGGRRLIEMPPSHLARRRSSAVKLSFLSYISSLPPFYNSPFPQFRFLHPGDAVSEVGFGSCAVTAVCLAGIRRGQEVALATGGDFISIAAAFLLLGLYFIYIYIYVLSKCLLVLSVL